MKKPIVFMFSGQGSQYYQMGRELYMNHSRFKLWMDHCDEIVFSYTGTSLCDVLYKHASKSEPFDRVLYTNPALLCIEYCLARVLMEMGVQPDYLLGYSLGEITASIVSGAITLEEGIEFIINYAELLENHTPPAAMLAIIESEDIMLQFPEFFQNCWLTGRNFKNNFVVSGLSDDIQKLQGALNRKDIISQKLPVNHGFHTELMDCIYVKFKQSFEKINILPIGIPIISSFKTEEIKEIGDNYFWEVTRYPVEFAKTINSMLGNDDYIFIDVGPSGSLATFIKYLLPAGSNSLYLETLNQFGKDLDSIKKLKTSLLL